MTSTGRATSSAAICGPDGKIAVGEPEFEDDVAAFDIAQVGASSAR